MAVGSDRAGHPRGRVAGSLSLAAVARPQAGSPWALTCRSPRAQEKERSARRKKKKAPAAASEEAAFPPVVEDEEMEASGASGNEEEMAEEAEGEGGRWEPTFPGNVRVLQEGPGCPGGESRVGRR